ncbi:hypothetical protein F511_06801 [Dorcoceras hygrometricum]|uniref:Uncharacterized protein n=1 Tax=Dorcoceras hygrometricum TaxID=472368 RepID=A0A2Z7CF22_9LAMI|nr:hypothetical protein F511_06801 [Dorcoceras hygrometricum]
MQKQLRAERRRTKQLTAEQFRGSFVVHQLRDEQLKGGDQLREKKQIVVQIRTRFRLEKLIADQLRGIQLRRYQLRAYQIRAKHFEHQRCYLELAMAKRCRLHKLVRQRFDFAHIIQQDDLCEKIQQARRFSSEAVDERMSTAELNSKWRKRQKPAKVKDASTFTLQRSVAPKWKEDKIAFWSAEEFWKLSNGKIFTEAIYWRQRPLKNRDHRRDIMATLPQSVDIWIKNSSELFGVFQMSVPHYSGVTHLDLSKDLGRKEVSSGIRVLLAKAILTKTRIKTLLIWNPIHLKTLGFIHMILGGPTEGNSNHARKARYRRMESMEVGKSYLLNDDVTADVIYT